MSQQLFPEQHPEAAGRGVPETGRGATHSSTEAALAAFWETVRKTAEQIVTLRQENASLQKQLALLRTENGEPRTENGELRTENALLSPVEEADGLRMLLAETEQKVAALEAGEHALRAVELQQQLEAREVDYSMLHLAFTEAQGQVTVLRHQLAELGKIEELRRQIDRLEDEIKSLEATVGERDTRIAQLQAELDALRVQEQASVETVERLAALDEQTHEMDVLKARLSELEHVAQLYEESQHRTAELDEQLAELKVEHARAVALVEKMRAKAQSSLFEDQIPNTENQQEQSTTTFSVLGSPFSVYSPEEALEVAERIEAVAKRLDLMLGLGFSS
jgi:chromosome segregation ATPase